MDGRNRWQSRAIAVYDEPAIIELAPLESGWKVACLSFFAAFRRVNSGDVIGHGRSSSKPASFTDGKRNSFRTTALSGLSTLHERRRSKAHH
jgi:hypothetical protein